KMLRRLIGENIEIVLALEPSLGNALADVGQIEQMIVNLAVNARDAMPDGGKLTIETANVTFDETYKATHPEVTPGQHVMLAVTDTGTGMTDEVKEHLFEPFFTTKPKNSGTGLGLATVYGMVKQNGGWIWVYSELERGTAFKIYLPLTGVAPLRLKATPKCDLHGTETILLVEDQAEVCKLAKSALERYGYKVLNADNGAAALSLSQEYRAEIHLLLTDVVMPGIPSRKLAELVQEQRPGIRVLYMSGYTERAFSQDGVLEDEVAYLQKPFTPESLAEKVRDVLGPASTAPTILVVDDDDSVRRWVRRVLTAERYAVVEAVNGRKALEYVKEGNACDLVITDLVMPEQEGLETIQTIRRERPELKIIAISGAFQGDFLSAATKLGAVAGLRKPLQAEELRDAVRRMLEADSASPASSVSAAR
ncbi:MAG TPA: response regulator, partial [Bryobacteraceae bacterium]